MPIVLVGLACLVAGIGLAAFVYEKELRRMARFLRQRPVRSNERLTVERPGRGFADMASAVNEQLDAMRDERVEGWRRQQEFQRDLASLSHDVRTPLMGAKGYLRLAQDDGDEAARMRRLDAAVERLDDMEGLVDQLFAYARANDPDLELHLRSVAVLPVLAGVLTGHFPAFDQRGWEPEVRFEDEALKADADEAALNRIFENLVGNMLRHGSAAPRIEQRGRVVTFSNEVDDPAGIEVDRLFDRFYRADASRSASGSGLGLAVAAGLAQAMSMRMDAQLDGRTLRVNLHLAG
ncbi:HAMP domain-containing histidine kinase [Eggerthella lenta]|uniref:sensor histidine kinase n=1 Tax=Eggerthella lenta TaxID=84112 RepID=UPI001D0694EA|nr:HAMP domain-containing sensor histidine kinase [Eggerthella lenta]MCB7056995.1 HAMP domain-containing histidine kinase [Eggerthella lenta]MDN4467340.1 HAMP domain-containing histidine kinase [Eggerthella lenta]GKG84531.1 two-component sensor histidine kinase [Eggerthella lenta]GKG88521.1 two-component sensor histidine kinase [Eggerthella lenta]